MSTFGAGKTTLVNRILASDHGLRIGVLVNDFGSVDAGDAVEPQQFGVLGVGRGAEGRPDPVLAHRRPTHPEKSPRRGDDPSPRTPPP